MAYTLILRTATVPDATLREFIVRTLGLEVRRPDPLLWLEAYNDFWYVIAHQAMMDEEIDGDEIIRTRWTMLFRQQGDDDLEKRIDGVLGCVVEALATVQGDLSFGSESKMHLARKDGELRVYKHYQSGGFWTSEWLQRLPPHRIVSLVDIRLQYEVAGLVGEYLIDLENRLHASAGLDDDEEVLRRIACDVGANGNYEVTALLDLGDKVFWEPVNALIPEHRRNDLRQKLDELRQVVRGDHDEPWTRLELVFPESPMEAKITATYTFAPPATPSRI